MVPQTLDKLVESAKGVRGKRVAVAAAADLPVLRALQMAVRAGFAEPVLIGEAEKIKQLAEEIGFDISGFELINMINPAEAAIKAVSVVKSGDARILMKGLVATAPLLKAVLDKEHGLRKREVLSHFALVQTVYYHKLLGITDAAMNILPGVEEKADIIQNAVEVFHALGNMNPKVAVVGPLEVVNEKIKSTADAPLLKEMAKNGRITGCMVDGPFAIDNAVSAEAARHKGITSEVAGDADILLAPGLDAGNILYKSLMFLSDGRSAAIITGAMAPIVLTSRADSEESKLYSLALASLL